MNNSIKQFEIELIEVLNLNKSRAYVFRTRLERLLFRVAKYARETDNNEIESSCDIIRKKLHYISDQSNQTSDGSLKSYRFLEHDINELKNKINCYC